MSETKYLISIAIGPVQDFIASARRSRDLWFGSWLLSELSKVVAETIDEKNLIFPASLSGNVVNKILAIVDSVENIEIDCRNAIEKKLKEFYEKSFTKIKLDLKQTHFPSDYFKEDVSIAQINDLVEFYWAAIPYDENDKTIDKNGKSVYENARERVEILLSARKATRNFNRVTWGDNVPKSSLDGQRESVIHEDAYGQSNERLQKEFDAKGRPKLTKEQLRIIFGVKESERLCGVGLLKRLSEKGNDDSFFSTSHLASLPLLDSFKDKIINDFDYIRDLTNIIGEIEVKEFKKIVGKTPIRHEFFENYDGHLLFEGRLKDFFDEPKLTRAKDALKTFMKDAFGKESKKPLPYFALLQADGDRMGTVIDNQKQKGDHKTLSEALSKFADNDVKKIVKDHTGCLIYSGGDDVLALLPLHTVLDCTRKLSEKFAIDLKDFKDVNNISPTLSAGIAVVHHTEPLQESLETMRNAEKQAKLVDGKNALAIILSKRSGADTIIKGSWVDDRKTGKSFDERLKWFIQLHLDDALPDGVAYELRDLWLRFSSVPSLKTAMEADAVRILSRKKSNQGLSKVSKNILGQLEGLILNKDLSLEDLANEIIVARDFKNAYKQAGKSAIGGTV
jgi:CRISPR-associated protein Cmr2